MVEEYISREDAEDAVRACCLEASACNLQCIKDLHAADVRPVVYCRDCYAYRRDKELAEAAYLDPKMYCGLLRCEMGENSFCSYGRRKGEKS